MGEGGGMERSNVLLDVKNLKMYYDVGSTYIRAVDGLSFSLSGAETLGVVGESGCGKSSLATTLLRLLPSNAKILEGEIIFKGIDLTKLPEEKMRKEIRWKNISIVFQGSMSALNPVIKVGDQVAEAILAHENGVTKKEALERAVEILAMVGLDKSVAKRYPFELSGGQRQRAVIAMALALRPKVVIADEPTTALDVIVQAQVLKLLESLQEKFGLSLMLISHDISVVSELSDRVAVMYAGKFVEIGPAESVLLKPAHPYTRLLIEAVPSVREAKKTLKYIPGQPPDLANPPSGCRFHPRCPYAMDVCRKEEPKLVEVEKNHYAACHLLGGSG
jgi:peptide/nickel transport system ATP-binding protein